MKFSLDRSSLQQALQQLGKVIPARTTLPILSSVLVLARDGKLSLRATDLELSQITTLSADVSTEGSVAIPHRTLLEITSEMPEWILSFEAADDHRVQITTSFGSYSIMGKPLEEFPALPEVDAQRTVSIPSSLLKRIIDKTIFAISRDELKPSLQGVLFRFAKESIQAVATDGHRLVRFINTQFSGSDYVGDNIIPGKSLGILGTYLNGDEEAHLNIGENHIMIQSQDTVLYTRIIEERFPDYDSVFPKESSKNLKIERDEVLAAVRRVSIFSNKTTHQIAFQLKDNDLKVSTEDVETVSNAQETLSCEYSGEPLTIGYNANYLRDILSHIDSSTVLIELDSPVTAAIFYPDKQQENEELTMLLMPIRLND